jgi:hypothetical protein
MAVLTTNLVPQPYQGLDHHTMRPGMNITGSTYYLSVPTQGTPSSSSTKSSLHLSKKKKKKEDNYKSKATQVDAGLLHRGLLLGHHQPLTKYRPTLTRILAHARQHIPQLEQPLTIIPIDQYHQ